MDLARDVGQRRGIKLELMFFFSSRRGHTRLQGAWSSDVCSSDLVMPAATAAAAPPLEPPGVRPTFQGLLVRPKMGLIDCAGSASIICTFVLPRRIPPAALRQIGRAHV